MAAFIFWQKSIKSILIYQREIQHAQEELGDTGQPYCPCTHPYSPVQDSWAKPVTGQVTSPPLAVTAVETAIWDHLRQKLKQCAGFFNSHWRSEKAPFLLSGQPTQAQFASLWLIQSWKKGMSIHLNNNQDFPSGEGWGLLRSRPPCKRKQRCIIFVQKKAS